MKLDLTKLSDAVAKVAGIAQAHSALTIQVAELKADHKAAQDAIDTLAVSLIAAATSPAEAAGLAAVAAAVAPEVK